MRRVRSLAVVSALVLAVALGAAGCTGSSGDTLTVYSGRTENLIGPLLNDFADETGIDIDVRYGQSADLALLVEQEGDKSPADVFISQSPGALGFLETGGRLSELAETTLDLVEPQYRDPDGQWVGLSGRVRVLVYNTDAVSEDELPESVFDLVNDEYAGRVGVAPENGSFQDFVSGMRESVGDGETATWLEGMADNDAQTYANNTAILEAVARGEIDMGLVNHYYNERAKAENPGRPPRTPSSPTATSGRSCS